MIRNTGRIALIDARGRTSGGNVMPLDWHEHKSLSKSLLARTLRLPRSTDKQDARIKQSY
jgi:hypothetical protein